METYKNIDVVDKFWIAYTDTSNPKFGVLSAGLSITTGQTTLEILDTEIEMSDRLGVLTGTPDYYDQNKIEDPVPIVFAEEELAIIRGTMVVSPWQLRRALNQLNLRDNVEAAVQAGDQDTQDGWDYASSFERLNPLVLSLAVGLGMTAEEMDDVFRLAVTFK